MSTGQVRTCDHVEERWLRYAPVECAHCNGWVQADRTVIDTRTLLALHPEMRQIVPAPPSKFMEANAIVGGIARALLGALFALIALGILAVIIASVL